METPCLSLTRRLSAWTAVFILIIVCPLADTGSAAGPSSMYGFVSYGGDESEPLDDAASVIRVMGAGWHQSEGPLTMSKGVSWGLIQPDNLDEYDWSTVAWADASDAVGLNMLMAVSPGHDNMQVNNYSPWVTCDTTETIQPTCNCPPTSYQDWYDFSFAVAEHFDGNHGAPRIDHFMTTGETDDIVYWLGTAGEYYGRVETVSITRRNGLGTVTLPAALVPVFWQGVHDANPAAKVVQGACTAWRAYAWTQLKEMIEGGAAEADVVNQAHQYGLGLSYDQIVNKIAGDTLVTRSLDFFYPSLAYPEYYEMYATHYYAPHGYLDALEFLHGKMAALGVNRPVWMTGEGRTLSAGEASHLRGAYLHFRRIVYSHCLAYEWHDPSFLVDVAFFNSCGMYTRPGGGRDYPDRHPLADTFRLLAHVMPTAAGTTVRAVISPYANTELYAFDITHGDTGYSGGAAAGWCSNTCPQFSSFETWCTDGCPKPETDLSAELGITPGTATAVLNVTGGLLDANCSGEAYVAFDEPPFLVVWGTDQDGDCIPDILDNCPLTQNPGQENSGTEHISGNGNDSIPAPDWIGDACDPCPEDGDPDCSTGCVQTGVTLVMPAHTFTGGDPFYLVADICNAESSALTGYPLFIILDISGAYWFAPDWSQDVGYYAGRFERGLRRITVIPEFQWPNNAGSAADIRFWGAFTTPDITDLFGDYSMWQFSWY